MKTFTSVSVPSLNNSCENCVLVVSEIRTESRNHDTRYWGSRLKVILYCIKTAFDNKILVRGSTKRFEDLEVALYGNLFYHSFCLLINCKFKRILLRSQAPKLNYLRCESHRMVVAAGHWPAMIIEENIELPEATASDLTTDHVGNCQQRCPKLSSGMTFPVPL